MHTHDGPWRLRGERSAFHAPGLQARHTDTSKYHEENRPSYEPRSKKPRRASKIIGITIASILAISILVAVDPFNPSLIVNPSDLVFTVQHGLNPPTQTLEIKTSREAVTWSAADDAQWLNLAPVNGSTDEDPSTTLSADISGMHPGEYAATITISAPDARNTPLKVPVSLVVIETKETLAIRERVGGNTDNVEIHYSQQPPYSKGMHYTSINLINGESATDPTWQELLQLILADDTDEHTYIQGVYMCGSFAETLHTNAEQQGMRAAWVAIYFADRSESHALNAFCTVDRGLVFVDCTGGGFEVVIPSLEENYRSDINHDKMAYVQLGKEYGLISLERAESPSYDFYENYVRKWRDYERRVEEYNRRVDEYISLLGGRTIIHDYSEYVRLREMHDELEEEKADLESQREILGGYRWEPLGVVSRMEIYW